MPKILPSSRSESEEEEEDDEEEKDQCLGLCLLEDLLPLDFLTSRCFVLRCFFLGGEGEEASETEEEDEDLGADLCLE